MENLIWLVWFIEMLNPLSFVLFIGMVGALAVSVISFLGGSEARDYLADRPESEHLKRKAEFWDKFGFKRYVVLFITFMLVGIALPSKEGAYKLLAIYGGVEVLKSPEVQKLGGKGVDVLNKVMDDYLEEGKE